MFSIPSTQVWAGHFTFVLGKIKCHPILPCAMVRAGKLLYRNLKIRVVVHHKCFKAIINVVIYFEANCSLEKCKLAFPRNLGKIAKPLQSLRTGSAAYKVKYQHSKEGQPTVLLLSAYECK